VLTGRELAAFKVVKAGIDAMISRKETEQAKTQKAAVEGLRPALSAGKRS
jgi:hypothetical protein